MDEIDILVKIYKENMKTMQWVVKEIHKRVHLWQTFAELGLRVEAVLALKKEQPDLPIKDIYQKVDRFLNSE